MRRKRKFSYFLRLFIEEAFFSILLGGAPMLIAAATTPKFVPTNYIQNLSPDDYVFWYFVSLFVLHIILSSLLKKWKKPKIEHREVFKILLRRTEQLSTAIHGVFRAIAGALPVGLYVLLEGIGFAKGWEQVTSFTVILATCMLIPCALMAYLSDAVADKDIGYDSSGAEIF
ncbi:hypothetical protein [Vibrio cyclitrophicus]|uniref:hypothetical protein n=1 Tax=Vibrio cyclitrophicus TaxID=47951 RepID=UPI00035ED94E|nr:hypothetical protein [Vibrio cyclitrophicus]NOH18289.1 hypothetical protein [Vibrio cyclitrophicus]OCH46479.1 hypothetical protein A6D96_20160 [Vibrio cyclitrophicus]PME79530.1 hypothetical protein BCV29_06120 [Vibrio cyclitrophicus]